MGRDRSRTTADRGPTPIGHRARPLGARTGSARSSGSVKGVSAIGSAAGCRRPVLASAAGSWPLPAVGRPRLRPSGACRRRSRGSSRRPSGRRRSSRRRPSGRTDRPRRRPWRRARRPWRRSRGRAGRRRSRRRRSSPGAGPSSPGSAPRSRCAGGGGVHPASTDSGPSGVGGCVSRRAGATWRIQLLDHGAPRSASGSLGRERDVDR